MATEPNEVTVRSVYMREDIEVLMSCKRAMAYRIIQRLNKELEDAGYITVDGRVSKAYANKRLGLVMEV